jgi:hypothetical protein
MIMKKKGGDKSSLHVGNAEFRLLETVTGENFPAVLGFQE